MAGVSRTITVLDFDAQRPAAPPRPAATTLVLRDGPSGLEVLCIVRHPKSTFLGGVLAFPGGKVDPADGDEAWSGLVTELPPRLLTMADLPVAPLPLVVAACREVLEETAVLPVEGDKLGQAEVSALRQQMGREGSLLAELTRAGLKLDVARLRPFARWVTPVAESRRYDATFFLLPVPAGQHGESDAHETTAAFWSTPSGVLSRWEAGELQLAPPTTRSLELLGGAKSVDEALSLADRQTLLPICPRFVPDESGGFLSLPGDPAHELADLRVDGPTRFVLREGRFVSAHAPRP